MPALLKTRCVWYCSVILNAVNWLSSASGFQSGYTWLDGIQYKKNYRQRIYPLLSGGRCVCWWLLLVGG